MGDRARIQTVSSERGNSVREREREIYGWSFINHICLYNLLSLLTNLCQSSPFIQILQLEDLIGKLYFSSSNLKERKNDYRVLTHMS